MKRLKFVKFFAKNSKQTNSSRSDSANKNKIFLIKKYYRNGLLEKKIMHKRKILKTGKWTKDEHLRFVDAGIKYGTEWRKVKIYIK